MTPDPKKTEQMDTSLEEKLDERSTPKPLDIGWAGPETDQDEETGDHGRQRQGRQEDADG